MLCLVLQRHGTVRSSLQCSGAKEAGRTKGNHCADRPGLDPLESA